MHSLMQCASQLTYGQPLDGLFSGYGLFLSSDSVLHWAVAMQSGFNVDLTAPLSTARWIHVAGVVDARQGFAALSMTTGVQLPASRHARLLFQASLCCGYYYHYFYCSSLSGSNPLTLPAEQPVPELLNVCRPSSACNRCPHV